LPEGFTLDQNYPNPFNPTTNIEYSIPEESFVELKVYDVLGNEVATLVNKEQSAGVYRADFNAIGLTSGFYIARISAGNYSDVIKMTLMK
ncbi:MAG: T9SS type A sorting domain-containing protein, partial [Melioribacteraceae bacterium]|nr:T9SS type A sorting domain-containing protein [Melioribacteraceae bacterium]